MLVSKAKSNRNRLKFGHVDEVFLERLVVNGFSAGWILSPSPECWREAANIFPPPVPRIF